MATDYRMVRLSEEMCARLDQLRECLLADRSERMVSVLAGDAHKSGRAPAGISYERLIAHLLDQRDRAKVRVARAKRRRASRRVKPIKNPLPEGGTQ